MVEELSAITLPEVDTFSFSCGSAGGPWKAKTLGMNWTTNPKSPYRYIYSGGPESKIKEYFAMNGGAKVAVVHWIGTDVLNFRNNPGNKYRGVPCTHWALWDNIQLEMRRMGIQTEVVVPPSRHAPAYCEEPGNAVAVYAPKARASWYYTSVLKEVDAGSDREFIWLPYPDRPMIDEIFQKCSTHVRLVKHDAFSMLVSEFMMAGRTVITNHWRPMCIRVEPNAKDILEVLNWPPCRQAHHTYREMIHPRHFVSRFRELIQEAEGK